MMKIVVFDELYEGDRIEVSVKEKVLNKSIFNGKFHGIIKSPKKKGSSFWILRLKNGIHTTYIKTSNIKEIKKEMSEVA